MKDGKISILIPARNEAVNLRRCLAALRGWADEIVVVDSGSLDGTCEVARSFDAAVVQFAYQGGWPKKRQWALDTYPFRNDWILLLDADEILDDAVRTEIDRAIRTESEVGYRVRLRLNFLGRPLAHGGFDFWKLALFRRGRGRFERRLNGSQTAQMSDVEVHEHVVVDGPVGTLRCPIRHENYNSLYRYIEKHNEYSEWEARLYLEGQAADSDLPPSLLASQAQRRRWLKRRFVALPGFPLLTFLYHYVFRLGFLDGRAGLIYCVLKGVQRFHAKAKWYELQLNQNGLATPGVVESTKP